MVSVKYYVCNTRVGMPKFILTGLTGSTIIIIGNFENLIDVKSGLPLNKR